MTVQSMPHDHADELLNALAMARAACAAAQGRLSPASRLHAVLGDTLRQLEDTHDAANAEFTRPAPDGTAGK